MPETYAEPAHIRRTGGSVCDLAEELRAAAAGWERDLADPAATVQLTEATRAIEAMRTAWAADFRVYQAVLERWCVAAQAAAAGFTSVDEYVASRLRPTGPSPGPSPDPSPGPSPDPSPGRVPGQSAGPR
ncbi:hypothetical protein [Micromonospora zhanjiangensis]|uniref:Excreted virulence factor EspC, type VII ESX diderm n=1 Tax=Micromonospora zhanjiangensis TaxID=1522057 RepID=A0ABV8KQJ4_9ACTN